MSADAAVLWAAFALAAITIAGATFAVRKVYAKRHLVPFESSSLKPYGLGLATGLLVVPFLAVVGQFGAVAVPRFLSFILPTTSPWFHH